MKYFLVAILLISIPACYAVSVAPKSTVPFFINDGNLDTSHKAVLTISTSGLVDFTINGVSISGPSIMTETAVDSGVFQLYLTIPSTVNGKPVQDGDIVVMSYHQKADYSGNPTDITQSITISVTPSSPDSSPSSSSQSRVGIGQTFLLQLYAPNWNLDSYTPDSIPLNLIGFRDGGLVTTLADSAFSIPTGDVRETGPNTNLFAAKVKIPKQVDGVPLDIGSTIEFSFSDPTEGPSPSTSYIFVTIGHTNLQNVGPSTFSPPSITTLGSIKDATNLWCGLNASDSSFARILEILSENKYVTITKPGSATQVPLWFKHTSCWWSSGKISDNDFLSGTQFSLDKGFLKI
ncbi:MAG: hypothetical protein D4R72_04785 [Nitrosopumilales archaeon]|nr:MAG: hypothetical protein D4R72_04785 [Nitrosopumilales archaeon]